MLQASEYLFRTTFEAAMCWKKGVYSYKCTRICITMSMRHFNYDTIFAVHPAPIQSWANIASLNFKALSIYSAIHPAARYNTLFQPAVNKTLWNPFCIARWSYLWPCNFHPQGQASIQIQGPEKRMPDALTHQFCMIGVHEVVLYIWMSLL